ncbi:hypothetical protein, partial [Shewanella gelidii]|uniref:hypothetical protein n=1 Tax=Shewanella gelidii TaxID=1642821 RepID=UPI00200C830F
MNNVYLTSQLSAGLLKLGSVSLRYTSLAKHYQPLIGALYVMEDSMKLVFAFIFAFSSIAIATDSMPNEGNLV